jgi:hypothetical protein
VVGRRGVITAEEVTEALQPDPLDVRVVDLVAVVEKAGYQVADTAGEPTLHIIRFAPVHKDGLVTAAVLLSLDVSDDQD